MQSKTILPTLNLLAFLVHLPFLDPSPQQIPVHHPARCIVEGCLQ